jgi:hypothetical protein
MEGAVEEDNAAEMAQVVPKTSDSAVLEFLWSLASAYCNYRRSAGLFN